MVDNPPEKPGYKVIVRTCRVVMDVRIRISEITPESVADYFTPDETGEGLRWEWAERQNRLLSALLKDEEALNQFLTNIAEGDFGFLLESKRITGMSDEEEDALFEKVYTGMEGDDRMFFEEAKKDGVLYDNIKLIHTAFATDWEETDVIDVCVLKPDDESRSSRSFPDEGK